MYNVLVGRWRLYTINGSKFLHTSLLILCIKMDDFVATYSLNSSLEIADKSTSSYQGSSTVLLDDRLNFFTRVCLVHIRMCTLN